MPCLWGGWVNSWKLLLYWQWYKSQCLWMDDKCFSSLIVMKKSLHNGLYDPWKRGDEKMRNNLSSIGPPFVMELAIYKQTTMMMHYVTNIHSINTLSSTSSHGCILHSLNPLFVLVFLISLLHFVCGHWLLHFVQMALFPSIYFSLLVVVILTWELPFLVDQKNTHACHGN
jgi:prepilin signal peptidase PulO-like enzyme (type II secretory pathway)